MRDTSRVAGLLACSFCLLGSNWWMNESCGSRNFFAMGLHEQLLMAHCKKNRSQFLLSLNGHLNVILPLFSSGVESIFHMLHLDLETWFVLINRGFPAGSDCKESACNAGDLSSIPELGRSPWEGNGGTLQYSYLENSMDRGAWWGIVHGVTKSGTQLSDQHFHFQWDVSQAWRVHVLCSLLHLNIETLMIPGLS